MIDYRRLDQNMLDYVTIEQNNGHRRHYLVGSLGQVMHTIIGKAGKGRLVFRDGSSIKFRKIWRQAFSIYNALGGS